MQIPDRRSFPFVHLGAPVEHV